MKTTNMRNKNTYSESDLSFEAMLDDSMTPSKSISVGDKVEARIIRIGKEYTFLDMGTRTEGMILTNELKAANTEIALSAGDKVAVFVTAFREGFVVCARRLGVPSKGELKDDKESIVAAIKDAYDAKMPVEGTVSEVVKGGFSVSIMGLRAFCPVSQIDNKYCEKPEVFVGQTMTFEIIKIEENGRNIVVSRRKLLEVEAEEKAKELWSTLEVGQTFDGTVSSIREYGAFVDIGGTDGLLHVSEISYDRVSDPKDVLQVGQSVKVAIKELDRPKRKISLSLKALMQDPWEGAADLLKPNAIYKGKVERITRFGAFVELMPGIEGLVHISEMARDKHVSNPRAIVSLGQEVEVRIIEIDREKKRVALTMNTDDSDTAWRENLGSSKGGFGMGTLGDLLKDKIK